MSSFNFNYTIDVDKEKAIVYVKVYGKWDAETAAHYHEDFVEEMTPLIGQPWAKLVDVSSWKTSRDEVTGVIGKHMAWSRDNGVALSLYVINNPSTYRQLNQMFTRGGTKEVSHTFRQYQEAEQFLKEHWFNRPKTATAK